MSHSFVGVRARVYPSSLGRELDSEAVPLIRLDATPPYHHLGKTGGLFSCILASIQDSSLVENVIFELFITEADKRDLCGVHIPFIFRK